MFLGKEVHVLLKGEAKTTYRELRKRRDKEAHSILRSIDRVVSVLKENPQFGNPIKKQLIPGKFGEMGIRNLYRTELSNFWRMVYTIEGTESEIFCFVLSITDHKAYDKLFGYRKS